MSEKSWKSWKSGKKLVSLVCRPLNSCDDDDEGASSYPSPTGASMQEDELPQETVEPNSSQVKDHPQLSFITTKIKADSKNVSRTQAEVKNDKTRKLVRSHVMKRHHAHLRLTKGYGRKETPINTFAKPSSILGEGRIDPFESYPRQVFASEHKIIDFYITHFSQLIDAVQQPEYTGCSSKIWFPAAIKEPMMFEALLLVGSRGLKALTQDATLDNKAIMYRARTTRLINDAMSDPQKATSDGAIAALLCLSFDEYNHGNFEAYDTHALAMWQLVKMRGGLEELGLRGFLAHMIRENDLASAYYRASRPYFEHKVKPREHVSIDAISRGFLAQEILSNISEDMIAILNDLSLISKALDISPIGVLPATGQISYQTLMGCQHTLLILCVSRKTPKLLLEHPDIEECVCLATEVFRARILCGYPPLVGAMGGDSFVGKDIYDSMMRILASDYRQECIELLFWVAFVGTLTAVNEAGNSRWVDAILKLAAELQIYGWDDAKTVLKNFLWYGRRCEEFWGKTWKKSCGTEAGRT